MNHGRLYSFIAHAVLTAIFVFSALALQADRDSERAVLLRLIESIERLEPLIARAERERDPQVRVQFRYDWLRRDLAEVRTGLEAYLMEAEFAPRSFEALQTEYHQ